MTDMHKNSRPSIPEDAAFQEIVNRAFSPDMPDPVFSEAYYQRKRRQERKVAMKDARKTDRHAFLESMSDRRAGKESRKESGMQSRTGAGFAILTACVTGMAGLAVCGGIGIYKAGRLPDQAAGQALNPGSEVCVPDAACEGSPEDRQACMGADTCMPEMAPESENACVSKAVVCDDSEAECGTVLFQCEAGACDMGCYTIQLNWIPDNLEMREDGPYGMKYHNYQDETDAHAITPYGFWRVQDSQMQFVDTVDAATCVTDVTVDSDSGFAKHMLYFTRSQGYAMLYVHFTGTPYVAAYFIDGFTEEEVYAFVEGMTLTETDTESEDTAIYCRDCEAEVVEDEPYIAAGIEEEQVRLVKAGDSVTLPGQPAVELHIDHVTLQSKFPDGTEVRTDSIMRPAEYTSYPDSDGYLYTERTIYDDDVTIQKEIVQQYVLRLDVTLTNNGTEPLQEETGMLFNMRWFSIMEDGTLWYSDCDAGHQLVIQHNPNLCVESSFFSFYTEHDHQKNGIYNLMPGESAECVFYYAIDADRTENLYIMLLDGVTGIYDVDAYSNAGYPLLDVSDLPVWESETCATNDFCENSCENSHEDSHEDSCENSCSSH